MYHHIVHMFHCGTSDVDQSLGGGESAQFCPCTWPESRASDFLLQHRLQQQQQRQPCQSAYLNLLEAVQQDWELSYQLRNHHHRHHCSQMEQRERSPPPGRRRTVIEEVERTARLEAPVAAPAALLEPALFSKAHPRKDQHHQRRRVGRRREK